MADHPIPFIYRIVFGYIDPFFCTIGALSHLHKPVETLTGYSPHYPSTLQPLTTSNPPVAVTHLMDSMAGFFVFLGLLEVILLRVRGRDVTVWRVVQGTASFLDWFMVYAAYKAMVAEDRFWDWRNWRGDDWRLVVGNLAAGLIRTCVAVGVGLGVGDEAVRVDGEVDGGGKEDVSGKKARGGKRSWDSVDDADAVGAE